MINNRIYWDETKEKNFEKLRTSNFKNILEKLQEKDNARLAIIEQYKVSLKN